MTAISTINRLALFQEIFDLGGACTIEGLSKEQFKHLSMLYPELQMERNQNGNINIMAPIKGGSGIREDILSFRVRQWRMLAKKGESFSPTTGFDLPNGSTRSPDASWVNQDKMDSLTGEQIENEFIPVVPDFIVELRSKSDRLKKVKEKMEKSWIANGVKLAWLIDPYKEKAYIYRIDGSVETVADFNQKLSGENILAGFELDLSEFRVLK
ncbi:MAG: Uma2 family endonuclease [Saprospiraceae bacterium]